MGKVCTNIFFLDSEQVRMGEMLPTKEIYNFYLVGEKQVQVGEFPPNSQPHPPPHPHPEEYACIFDIICPCDVVNV